MKKNRKTSGGFSILLVVLVVAAMLALVLYVLQANSVLQARRASQTYFSQAAFFIAEGAIYRTVDQYANGQFAPNSLPIADSWEENGAIIKRAIYQDENGPIIIEITANVKGSKRKFMASFEGEQATRAPIEVAMIIDVSGSMYLELEDGNYPIDYIKQAAVNFVEIIEEISEEPGGPTDRISLVVYGDLVDGTDKTAVIHPLSAGDNYDEITDLIESIGTIGPDGEELFHYRNTPSANGIAAAIEELDRHGRASADKYFIFFSDGMANRPLANIADSNIESLITTSCGGKRCSRGCPDFPCFDAVRGVGCKPYDGGSCCTHDAVLQAELARGELEIGIPYDYDFTIFSIFLENIPPSWSDFIECNSDYGDPAGNEKAIEMAIKLGRETMEAIANPPTADQEYFFSTDSVDELTPIFEQIATTITTPGGISIIEVAPEPD